MRLAKTMFCAAALFALVAPGVRADDYNKLTYFTFSAPVQVPGANLPAGTYMFKLANPESGRRAIQIWDQGGQKLLTTLLTVTDQRMEIAKQPLVMFNEAPSGEAPAVRSWFYEGERIGYEFIYPKDQAMRIARAAHTSVLAMVDRLNAQPTRIDESGAFVDAAVAASTTATATSAPEPSANRTESTAPSARIDPATPVGTTGSASATAAATSSAPQSTSAASTTSTQPAPNTAAELPATASSLPLFQLLSGVFLLSALSVRKLRRRLAESR